MKKRAFDKLTQSIREAGEIRRGVIVPRGVSSFEGAAMRVDAMSASLERVWKRELRRQTISFFLAWAIVLAAIIGLYFRV